MLHPEMMQTLRTEVDTLEEVTYDNHKQLVQCLAVFNEGLRVRYNSSDARVATDDFTASPARSQESMDCYRGRHFT